MNAKPFMMIVLEVQEIYGNQMLNIPHMMDIIA